MFVSADPTHPAALSPDVWIGRESPWRRFPARGEVSIGRLLRRVNIASSPSNTTSTISRAGDFNTSAERFLGVKFDLSGASFFGWVGLEVEQHRLTARVTAWAYEDTGAPIRAGEIPEPSPLALLAMGAAGIAALRRRTRVDANDT